MVIMMALGQAPAFPQMQGPEALQVRHLHGYIALDAGSGSRKASFGMLRRAPLSSKGRWPKARTRTYERLWLGSRGAFPC